MPVWPDGVPSCMLVDSPREGGPQGATIRTPMDTGPAKVRRRTTAAPRTTAGTFTSWTRAQTAEFEAWFRTGLAFGALPFDMVSPRTGQTEVWRFLGSYDLQQVGNRYQMSATFEVLP